MSVQYGTQSLPHRLLRACVVCVCVRTVAVHIIQCVKGERERHVGIYMWFMLKMYIYRRFWCM